VLADVDLGANAFRFSDPWHFKHVPEVCTDIVFPFPTDPPHPAKPNAQAATKTIFNHKRVVIYPLLPEQSIEICKSAPDRQTGKQTRNLINNLGNLDPDRIQLDIGFFTGELDDVQPVLIPLINLQIKLRAFPEHDEKEDDGKRHESVGDGRVFDGEVNFPDEVDNKDGKEYPDGVLDNSQVPQGVETWFGVNNQKYGCNNNNGYDCNIHCLF
jgi:hypothetical protein